MIASPIDSKQTISKQFSSEPKVPAPCDTLADLLERVGSVPLDRIPAFPPVGTATEEHLFRGAGGEKRLYELVDGVLVEKPMGFYESLLAAVLSRILGNYVEEHDLGLVFGADAPLRLRRGLVRLPDVSFFSWSHFPNRKLPRQPVADLVPDLAVEVISKGNTKAEMKLKLREYFTAGAALVWYVYPNTQTVDVYTSPTEITRLTVDDTLDGGAVLPGFRFSIKAWFERAGERGE